MTTSPNNSQWNRCGGLDRLRHPAAVPARRRLAAAVLAVVLLLAVLLSGTGMLRHDTDAQWTASASADGAFTAMPPGPVENLRCTDPLFEPATVSWERPNDVPSGIEVRYQVTATSRLTGAVTTTEQSSLSHTYGGEGFAIGDRVTIAVRPLVKGWNGAPQSTHFRV